MESWRNVWRKAAADLLTVEMLEALRAALTNDDPRLIQGATTTPPPLQCVQDWPVECACLIGYCGAMACGGFAESGKDATGAASVAQVEEFFARMCFEIDQRMGEPAACRWLLNWYDDTPREEMRRELLMEVQRTLADRLRGGALMVRRRVAVPGWSLRGWPGWATPAWRLLDGESRQRRQGRLGQHGLAGLASPG